jgi:methionine synthase I (cobalamin-dependent)/REP element-mobilizing transposase RayT
MGDHQLHPLEKILQKRIAIMDGAMGTMIQRYKLSEADYRGERFRDWDGKDLKGSLELLLLTKPDVIREIHTQYLDAGTDLIETNTFSGTTIGLHDFLFKGEPTSGRKDIEFFQRVVDDKELCDLAYEINLAAGQIAREAADRVSNATGQQRFVIGSMGPLPVAASLSPDVNDPSFRAVTFDQIEKSYAGQAAALIEGGVDFLAVETVFDTLNAKAAISAITQVFERAGKTVPLIISGTVTDLSGRTLSGQTVEAFLISIAHAKPLVLSLNCALGPNEMKPYVEELSRHAPTYTAAYPNAGLPDPLSPTGFPETPETFAPKLREWAQNGWLNIVGGCCGTTPDHIRKVVEAVREFPPREIPRNLETSPNAADNPGSARASRAVSGASPETSETIIYSRRRLPHFERPWAKYAVSFSTHSRRRLSEDERDLVLQSIIYGHEHNQYELYVGCVMPDHVHLLFEPQVKDKDNAGETVFWSLTEILHGIKSTSAHRINKATGINGAVWEKESFDRVIRSESDLQEKFSYICRNPWDSKVVEPNQNYPWLWTAEDAFGEGAERSTRGACAPQRS